MTIQDRDTLKGYFNSGDVPTEAQFSDVFDSITSGSGTSGRLVQWSSGSTLTDSTLISTGVGILTVAGGLGDETLYVNDTFALGSVVSAVNSITLGEVSEHAQLNISTNTAVLGHLKIAADKTLTVSNNAAISGTNTGDQSGANPTASVGLTAVNGAAATFMRSDGAPALDVGIIPTWTAVHTFSNTTDSTSTSTGAIVTSGGIGVAKAVSVGTVLGIGTAPAATAGVVISHETRCAALYINDAGTNNVPVVMQVIHNSSDTPVNGFGIKIEHYLNSSTTDSQFASVDQVLWADATHASRKARRIISVYDTAAREALRLEASGSAAMIGFLGAAAVARQAHIADATDAASAITRINAILVVLENFGMVATS